MTWIVLDCNFLCHRAFHSTGGLAHGGEPTGVLFGFFAELRRLEERFGTRRVVFAFDGGRGLRQEKHPYYKRARRTKERTPEEDVARAGMLRQVDMLRAELLPGLGYENVRWHDGYEADDQVAAAVRTLTLTTEAEAVVVSADKDLYQLLGRRVALYNPAKPGGQIYTARDFKAEYGLHPSQWPIVKAIAGCPTDEVPGVPGVREATAARWLMGSLPAGKKKSDIDSHVLSKQHIDNLELVRLPYPGTPAAPVVDHPPPSAAAWDALCRRFGFASLAGGADARRPLNRGRRG